jgi:hypothetical protein
MTKAESKVKFLILIDISSLGFSIKTDEELALESNATVPYVQAILKGMVRNREIDMVSYQNERRITYPKKLTGKLF